MTSPLQMPLSDAELIELDGFLLATEEGEERLLLDEAHGFTTALLVSRQPYEQAAWLESIWGEPRFGSGAESEHLTALMLRLRQSIVEQLASHHPFEPLVAEEEDNDDGTLYENYEGWCFGFMLAVANDEPGWGELPQEAHDALAPIATLALLYSQDEPDMDEEEYEACLELIPGSVAQLYNHFAPL